jgi:hypothetical protein
MTVLLGRVSGGRRVNSIFGEGVNPLMRKIRGSARYRRHAERGHSPPRQSATASAQIVGITFGFLFATMVLVVFLIQNTQGRERETGVDRKKRCSR